MVHVRPVRDDEQAWKVATLEHGWGSVLVARFGELVDAGALPAVVATVGDDRVGLLTYADRPDGVEVVTIESLSEGIGVGRALMAQVHALAVARDAPRLWLVTTNDNRRAIDFYVRWGMRLVRVIDDGVEISRRVKPSIPVIGVDGSPLRDELEFELVLRS